MSCDVYFVQFTCFLTTLVLVGTTVGIEQDPNPVQVGNNVTLTCNATAKREIKKLKWIVAEKEVDPNDEGVVHLWPSSLKNSNLTISSVLMLFVKKKNGDKWPKSVTCKVELKPEKGQSVLEYNRTLEVNVTGKFLVESVKRLLLTCLICMCACLSCIVECCCCFM